MAPVKVVDITFLEARFNELINYTRAETLMIPMFYMRNNDAILFECAHCKSAPSMDSHKRGVLNCSMLEGMLRSSYNIERNKKKNVHLYIFLFIAKFFKFRTDFLIYRSKLEF